MKHGTRSTVVAVLATAALLSPLADVAEAAKKRTERFRLIDPTGVSEAKGKVRVQVRRNKETVRIRLSRLVPGTTYEVRDADTAELLGEVTANRKGKARLNVKRQLSPVVPGKRAGDPTTAVSVVDGASDRVVLLGDAEQGSFADALEAAGFADAVYVDPRGSRATVTTFSDGFGHGFFELDLFVYDGGNERTPYRASMDTLGDRGMPEILDDVEQLAGRPFDIVDAADSEVLAGTLPELISLGDLFDGVFALTGPSLPEAPSAIAYRAPFRLRVALEGSQFVELVVLGEGVDEDPGVVEFEWGDLAFGHVEHVHGSVSLYRDDSAETFAVSISTPVPGNPNQVRELNLARYGTTGTLPLGVDSLDELAGRRMQVRGSDGIAFIERDLPALTDAIDPSGSEFDGERIDVGPTPWTLWIDDHRGRPQKVGRMEETTYSGGDYGNGGWWDPNSRHGGVFIGDYFGTYASLGLYEMASGYESLSVSVFISSGGWFSGTSHALTLDKQTSGNSLPFGVDGVADLSGRAFELRNGDGSVVFADDVPVLEPNTTTGGTGPNVPPKTAFEPGRGPFELWIEDDLGTLRKVGTLQKAATDSF